MIARPARRIIDTRFEPARSVEGRLDQMFVQQSRRDPPGSRFSTSITDPSPISSSRTMSDEAADIDRRGAGGGQIKPQIARDFRRWRQQHDIAAGFDAGLGCNARLSWSSMAVSTGLARWSRVVMIRRCQSDHRRFH